MRIGSPSLTRPAIAIVAAFIAALHVTAALHFTLVAHTVCAEHGHVTHAVERAGPPAPSAPRQTALQAPSEEPNHDHCVLAGTRHQELVVPASAEAGLGGDSVAEAPRPPSDASSPRGGAPILLVAPKQSPPA